MFYTAGLYLCAKISTIMQERLKEYLEEVRLCPSDIRVYSENLVSINQASQWLAALKNGDNLQNPTLLMLWFMCDKKRFGVLDMDTDFSHDQIVKRSSPVTDLMGVYFLIRQGKIVYVGQSVSVATRVQTHKSFFEFDKVCVIRVPQNELTRVEKHYIQKFRPMHNKAANPDNTKATAETRAAQKTKIAAKILPEVEGVLMGLSTDTVNLPNGSFIKKPQGIFVKHRNFLYFSAISTAGLYKINTKEGVLQIILGTSTSFGPVSVKKPDTE